MESILSSVKKMLGITEDYEYFDSDLIIHINSVFSILTQLGVGPENGFIIENKNAVWEDFLNDEKELMLVRSYIYLKVRLLFDPPQSSGMLDSCTAQIKEYEWRLNVAAENKKEKTIEQDL